MTNDPPLEPRAFTIPESEIWIDFVRSSGPGGQKVNKTSSKAQLRWRVDGSAIFSDEQKKLINEFLANRINKEGEVVLASDQERSQLQNKENAVALLHSLVAQAITPQRERIATKPTRSSRKRRLDEKARQSKIKKSRGNPSEEW